MFLQSCHRNKIKPVVIGLGRDGEESIPHAKRKFLYKLTWLRDWLQRAHENELVFLTDSWDVFLDGGLDELQESYKAADVPVLFAAERKLWPPGCYEGYPESHTPYRYLNSGGFIGPAGVLLTILAECDSERIMDQHYYHRQFLKDQRLQLDTNCTVFQCLNGHPVYPHDTIPPELEFLHGHWVNTITGSVPLQIHGNGKNFNALRKMWERVSK